MRSPSSTTAICALNNWEPSRWLSGGFCLGLVDEQSIGALTTDGELQDRVLATENCNDFEATSSLFDRSPSPDAPTFDENVEARFERVVWWYDIDEFFDHAERFCRFRPSAAFLSEEDAELSVSAAIELHSMVDDGECELPSRESSESGQAEAVSPPPAFVAGGITTGAVALTGVNLEYALITPEGFVAGAEASVFVALPDEGDDLSATRSLTQGFFLDAALDRGWVVVSPTFAGADTGTIADLTEWIETWVTVDGKPHLGGFGGGGTAAFAIASQNPTAFQSLMIYPGLPPTPVGPAARVLADVPIRMWVVNTEGNRWITPMTEFETASRAAGGKVSLSTLSEGQGTALSDAGFGSVIFDELFSLR